MEWRFEFEGRTAGESSWAVAEMAGVGADEHSGLADRSERVEKVGRSEKQDAHGVEWGRKTENPKRGKTCRRTKTR